MKDHLVPQPVIVGKYNIWMGGVDLKDMATASVKATIKSRRPTRCMFLDVVGCIADNSKCIWAHFHGKTPIKSFMEVLCMQLVAPLQHRFSSDSQ